MVIFSRMKKFLLIFASILVFIGGCLVYGLFLNVSQKPLREEMLLKKIAEIDKPVILIDRRKYVLKLNQDTTTVKEYRVVFGMNSNPKTESSDRSTPIGEYKTTRTDSFHTYYKMIYIDYPNDQDIAKAYRHNVIDKQTYESLRFSYFYKNNPIPSTPLGGNVGIHGIGKLNYLFKNLPFVFNWTDGSIAMSNEDLDELLSVVKPGTPVIIF